MNETETYHDSWKESRDLILEYNQVDLRDAGISNILGMALDDVSFQQAIVKIMKMIEDGGIHHVITVNPYKLVRYHANIDLNIIYSKASMKIATGAGVARLAKRARRPIKEQIHFLGFLMELIRLSEIKEYTIFFVGARPETAEKAYANIMKSFPQIRIVGHHGGYFNKQREEAVIEAIRKSEADIVLVGMGFPKEDKWIAKLKMRLQNSVIIGIGGTIDVISGENRKAPPYFMERNLDWLWRIISKPWRYLRLIRVIFLYIHVFFRSFFISQTRYYR